MFELGTPYFLQTFRARLSSQLQRAKLADMHSAAHLRLLEASWSLCLARESVTLNCLQGLTRQLVHLQSQPQQHAQHAPALKQLQQKAGAVLEACMCPLADGHLALFSHRWPAAWELLGRLYQAHKSQRQQQQFQQQQQAADAQAAQPGLEEAPAGARAGVQANAAVQRGPPGERFSQSGPKSESLAIQSQGSCLQLEVRASFSHNLILCAAIKQVTPQKAHKSVWQHCSVVSAAGRPVPAEAERQHQQPYQAGNEAQVGLQRC